MDDEDERACATGTVGEPALLALRPFPFSFSLVFFVFFLSRFSFFSFALLALPLFSPPSCDRGDGWISVPLGVVALSRSAGMAAMTSSDEWNFSFSFSFS